MRGTVALLLFLGACGKGPYGSFDAGHDVHVIVVAEPVPQKGIWVEPVVTLGPVAVTSPRCRIQAKEAPAVEVAILRAPTGRHRLSIWEPRHRVSARMELEVKAETWVVLTMRRGELEGKLRDYDKPPVKEIGPYVQLVPVPD